MDRYIAEREEFIASGAPGLDSARSLAQLTDEALARLASAARVHPPGTWALVALGGYGAGTLLPASDIDVLLLSDAPAVEVKPFVESLLYPLWDAGLSVGHQVRSPKAHLAATRNNLATLAATLTGRVVAGDSAFGLRTITVCANAARKRSRRVLAAVGARERPGSPYLLEPDLKSGAGGRRDYDELVWTAAILTGQPQQSPEPLAALGLLRADEFSLLHAAAETTAAARWELHRAGEGNRFPLDAERAMRTDARALQRGLADTAHVLDRVRMRVAGRAGTDVDAAPLGSDVVFQTLRRGESGLPTLERAAWAGSLDALIPGFRDLMTLRRPALTHTLTVGAHSLRCAALVASLGTDGQGSLGQSRSLIGDDRALLVAALTHDVGKRDTGSAHPERGASLAAESAVRFGLDADASRDVSDLVRLHLALAQIASSEDLDSEDAILVAARRVGRRELVAPLHLLTVADSIATGPEAWGAWQEALLGTLVSRLDAALSPDVDGAGLASRGETVRAATLASLGADVASPVIEFIRHAPLRYLASREPAQIAYHARLVAGLPLDSGPVCAELAVQPGPLDGTYEAAIVARDHPEALARVTGALTLAGLDILSVDAFGTPGGVVLDIFVVRSATLAPLSHETWQRAERYMRAALSNRLELETRLAERRRHYPQRKRKKRVPAAVDIDTSAGYETAVRVVASDRVGLLYDLLRAVSAVGLRIRWAKAITTEGVVTDTFHIVDSDGQAPTDAGVLGHLAMRLRENA